MWSEKLHSSLSCFNIKPHFWTKYECILHNNTLHCLSSSHSVYNILSIMYWTISLVKVAWSVHISLLIQTRCFSGESNNMEWIIDFLAGSNTLKLQYLDGFLTNTQLFTSQDVNWWTVVEWVTCGLLCYIYQLFGLSFWRHPFTVEDSLVSRGCYAKFLKICSDEETNVLYTAWMVWWWVNLLHINVG